jgi:hypothetical protein
LYLGVGEDETDDLRESNMIPDTDNLQERQRISPDIVWDPDRTGTGSCQIPAFLITLAPGMSVFPSPVRCRAIPPDTPHSVILCLPKWEDNVDLANSRNKILIDISETTYPRILIHNFVKQVRCIPCYLFCSCFHMSSWPT